MTKKNAKLHKAELIIIQTLESLGFHRDGDCEVSPGRRGILYSRFQDGGTLHFAFTVAFSTNRALFVTASIGLSNKGLGELYAALEAGNSNRLAYPYAMIAWGVGENAREFDPSLANPGGHFSFPENDLEAELGLVRSRLFDWTECAAKYLTPGRIGEFYRFDSYIDRSYRWREIVAVLKLLRGEEYVGIQLLNDLVDESAGRRAIFGEYDSPMFRVFGLRKNESELVFHENLRANAKNLLKTGMFAKLMESSEIDWAVKLKG